MNARVTFALMLAFLVLGSFAFFDPLGFQQKKEEKAERDSHVFWLKDKKLEALTVKNGDQSFVFQCVTPEGCPLDGSADWKLTQPVDDLADEAVLGSLAATLKNLTAMDKIQFDNAPDPAEFGFPETRLAVELKAKGETEPYALNVGRAAPVGANVYVQSNRNPNTIYLVAATLPGMLKQDLFHWRNKRLFPGFQVEKVERISWNARTVGQVTAERGEKGWQLKLPIQSPAGGVMLEGLASTLVYANAKAIYAPNAEDPAAKKALSAAPLLEVRFGPLKGEESTLKLYTVPGSKPGSRDFVAQVSGFKTVFLVEGTPFDRFVKPVSEYRDRRLFPGADLFKVNRMSLRFRDGKSITLEKRGDIWDQLGEPAAEPLSPQRVGGFFEKLNNAEARDFVKAPHPAVAAYKKGPFDVEVSLAEGDKPVANARFVVLERQFAVTHGANEQEVRRFGEDFLKLLPIRLQDLYVSSNKQVITEPKEDPHGHHHSHGDGHAH